MKHLGKKLMLTYAAIVLFSILLISVPTLQNQFKVLNKSVIKDSVTQIQMASDSINFFLDSPVTMLKTVSAYVKRADFTLKQAQDDFAEIIKDNPEILCLYYADPHPMNALGMLYSSDRWIPEMIMIKKPVTGIIWPKPVKKLLLLSRMWIKQQAPL